MYSQAELEMLYSRRNIVDTVLKQIDEDFTIQYKLRDSVIPRILEWTKGHFYESKNKRLAQLRHEEDIQYLLEDIMAVVLIEQYTTIQAVCGRVASQMSMDTFNAVKCIAELMVFMAEADLFDLVTAKASETGSIMVQAKYDVDEEIREYINNTMYLPPMIEAPEIVQRNYDMSYKTIKSWMILGNENKHVMPIGLDVINILNQIELELDERVLMLHEQPNKKLDTVEKVKQFEAMRKASRKVYDLLLEHGNSFYLTWKYDKRGRIYSQGYHVNIQSTEYKKALINLKRKELIEL